MALVNPMGRIQKAQELGIAIASFTVHNLETLQAVAGEQIPSLTRRVWSP